MSKELSVIIPTHNRSAILARTLDALRRQTFPPDAWEVVVVDDGSTDDTASMVACLGQASAVPLRYLQQENRGAATARNQGLLAASGRFILFLDSDIIASPELVAEHYRSHQQFPASSVAILGRVTLAEDIAATRLNQAHVVHKWHALHDGQEVSWQYFISCNISVKRGFLIDCRLFFDENLAFPAYDDTELGYRAAHQGLQIYYNARALGYHEHHLTAQDFLRVSQRGGEAVAVLHRKYPEIQSTFADYLNSSWRDSPTRMLRRQLGAVLINPISIAGLLRLEQQLERRGRSLPDFLVLRIGNYCERAAYRRRAAELATT